MKNFFPLFEIIKKKYQNGKCKQEMHDALGLRYF